MRKADGLQGSSRLIRVFGTGSNRSTGAPSLYRAKCGDGHWASVSAWHVVIADYFHARMIADDSQLSHPARAGAIDSPAVANACVQLAAAICGINGTQAEKEDAAREINNALRALGLPAGAWSYSPILAAITASAA